MHHHFLFHQVDEGQEKLPVQPVLVEVIRHAVRGGHHHDTGGEEGFEQSAHDHRIGDIGDLHFVEGQKPHGLCHLLGNRGQGVLFTAPAGGMHAPVDFLHEGVEMHPAVGHIKRFDEHVHQHGFAAPDAAPDIEPLGRLG